MWVCVYLYKVVDPYSLSTRVAKTEPYLDWAKSLACSSFFYCFQIIIQNSGATLEFNLAVNLHQAVLTSSFSSNSSSLFQSLESLGHGEIKDSDVTLLRAWPISRVRCGLNVKYHSLLFLSWTSLACISSLRLVHQWHSGRWPFWPHQLRRRKECGDFESLMRHSVTHVVWHHVRIPWPFGKKKSNPVKLLAQSRVLEALWLTLSVFFPLPFL